MKRKAFDLGYCQCRGCTHCPGNRCREFTTTLGPEIGVASTKAFISQLTIMALLTLFLGRQRNLSLDQGQRIAQDIQDLPEKAEIILTA